MVCGKVNPPPLSVMDVEGKKNPIHDMNWKRAKANGLDCADRFGKVLKEQGVDFKVYASEKLRKIRAKKAAERRQEQNRQAWIAAGLDPKKFGEKNAESNANGDNGAG
jgi:hypothetical protein|tara:strand:- start:229 stop:552 length:324 start_codon:yes stop_codon:yes gene_type:complete